MACTSFSLSNNLIGNKFYTSSHRPISRVPLRVSASYATADRISENAPQTVSFYEVLGIQTGATCLEIKSAYWKLARVLHPDVASNRREENSSSAADEFMRLHAAYSTLSDPEKRAVYDSTFYGRRRRVAGLSASGYPNMNVRRRSWETDQCW